eukprot:TRINITY_DN13911_c0_g1_i1.p1 TRINITY_DN13911_c0_g1~~TRINITY_DN13911_c0_g1_i1.p1  ORF type:complete len:319 (+),score=68.51 TRINITY_DN13911_c0_g1_i1:61-957(+)
MCIRDRYQRRVHGEKHYKEQRLLDLKLHNTENKLKIKMAKEYEVLKKQIGLHENEIKRIQNLAIKSNLKKGIDDGELKRTKDKSRKQNDIISQTKLVDSAAMHQFVTPQSAPPMLLRKGSSISPGRTEKNKRSQTGIGSPSNNRGGNITYLKGLISSGNLTKFYIRQQYGQDLPVNVRQNVYAKESGDNHHKIEKYLIDTSKKNFDRKKVPPLTALYDDNLEPKKVDTESTMEITDHERERRKKRLEDRLTSGEENFKLKQKGHRQLIFHLYSHFRFVPVKEAVMSTFIVHWNRVSLV